MSADADSRARVVPDRTQDAVLLALCVGVAVLASAASLAIGEVFARVLGEVSPLLAFAIVIPLGAALLSMLRTRGWFAIYGGNYREGLVRATGLAMLFGLAIIAVDVQAPYPEGINVPFPSSLLFYPVIGFLVEVLFHLVPLSVLLVIGSRVFSGVGRARLVLGCIVIVAVLEASYLSILDAPGWPPWALAYEWLHISLIGLSQLLLFRRYDFVTMYSLRLAYYLAWHVVWGYVRLQVLF